jgi:hypothetical protein
VQAEPGEALKDYFQRFVQVKARAPDVPHDVAIEAAIKGLRIGPFAAHLAKEKPATMQGLYTEFEKYCRSDNDYCKRLKEQNQGKQQGSSRNMRRGNNGQNQQQQKQGQDQQVFNIEHQAVNQQNQPHPQFRGQASTQKQYQSRGNDQGKN